jgi:hypothetical protein
MGGTNVIGADYQSDLPVLRTGFNEKKHEETEEKKPDTGKIIYFCIHNSSFLIFNSQQ